jgi:hypothetical protein
MRLEMVAGYFRVDYALPALPKTIHYIVEPKTLEKSTLELFMA